VIISNPSRRAYVLGGSGIMSDFDVGFVIFPGITQLDFTGPFEVLSRLATPPSVSLPSRFPHSRTHVIAKSLHPVSSDRGLSILPTCTFDNSPSLNLICVPGGAGVVDALADVETVDFIRRQGAHAQFVTSVCIGAFLLGAAGLLKGRRAATHWAYVDLLPLVGASHERSRIVRDGNVFTSGGVTSGIDFAFGIVAELAGPEVAQAIQLAIEYDPSPPFDAGHPDKATEATTAFMIQRTKRATRVFARGSKNWRVRSGGRREQPDFGDRALSRVSLQGFSVAKIRYQVSDFIH
jgi:cyclohexyl-isocyanide hydratase